MPTSHEIIETFGDEIDLLIQKIRYKKDRYDLMRWLDNFDDKDKTSALDILHRLVFVDDDQLHFEADDLVRQIEISSPTNSIFYFYPIAKYGKSATLVSYFFQHSPRFVALQNSHRAFFLNNEYEVNTTVVYDDTVLVFFDDFLGSGGSFIKSYENLAAISSPRFRLNQLQFAASIYRMPVAEQNIREAYPLVNFLGNVHHKLFDPDVKMFESIDEISRQKALALSYAERNSLFINKEGPHHLGYRDSEALISFAYKPPNNTLPIIWAAKKSGWRAFLPRYQSEIYNSVRGYKNNLLAAAAKLEFGLPREAGVKKLEKKRLNMLLVLSMMKRKTSVPLIAVIIGISIKDLEGIFDTAIDLGYLTSTLTITEKGFGALKEVQNIVDEIKNDEKIKKQVKDYNIEYLSRTVPGK